MEVCWFSVLLTASFMLLFTSNYAQEEFYTNTIEARIGFPKTLQCQMKTGHDTCSWKHNGATYYSNPNTFEKGYTFVGDSQKGNCDMKINSVGKKDNGQWDCSIPGNEIDKRMTLVVLKKPSECFLEYNGQSVAPGTIVPVSPHSETITVACEVKGSTPKAEITWEGEDIFASDSYEELVVGPKNDGTFDVRSELTFRIPQVDAEKKKKITCVIQYSKKISAIKVTATFVEHQKTESVTLKADHGVNKNEIILSCKADGIPEPKYHILMTTPRKETYIEHEGQTRTVTTGGVFVCLAGNHYNSELLRSVEEGVHITDSNDESSHVNEDQNDIRIAIFSVVGVTVAIGGVIIYVKCCYGKKKASNSDPIRNAEERDQMNKPTDQS